MTDRRSISLSAKLRSLTSELRALDQNLKSEQSATASLLSEFREALDNVRMTSWTVNELMNARHAGKDPQTVLSFLATERLRRFSELVNDLCGEMEHEGITLQTRGIQDLSDSLRQLQDRLGKLAASRRGDSSPNKPPAVRAPALRSKPPAS